MNEPAHISGEIAALGRDTGVKSAHRVLEIFEYFAKARTSCSLAVLAKNLALPKSSCLALLNTLESCGYLYRLVDDQGYYPTRRLLDLGQEITTHDPVLRKVRPVLQALRDQSGETAILARRSGGHAVYLDVLESDQILRFSAHAGQRKPLHAAASGQALLAAMPNDERRALIGRLPFTRYSNNTLTSATALAARIQVGQVQGWFVNQGEYQADTLSVAASFALNGNGYALTIGAPLHRAMAQADSIGQLIKAFCGRLNDAPTKSLKVPP